MQNCPEGTFYDKRNYKCSFTGDESCQLNFHTINQPLSIDFIKQSGQKYIQTYLHFTNSVVDILKGPEYLIEFFHIDKCQYDISYENDYTYVNFTECEKLIKNVTSPKKVVFAKVDIRRKENNNTPNKIEYVGIDEDGKVIDLSVCKELKNLQVTYPILGNDLSYLETGKKYYKMGIDIFELKDSFFHDICYAFSDENGKDIILKDRREYIYIFAYLCPLNCEYRKIEYDCRRSVCECPVLINTTLEYNDDIVPKDNPLKFKGERNYNWLLLKCVVNLNLDKLMLNEGTITICCILTIQLIFLFIYILRSSNKFSSAVIRKTNFERTAHPPKRNSIAFMKTQTDEDSPVHNTTQNNNYMLKPEHSIGYFSSTESNTSLYSLEKNFTSKSSKTLAHFSIILHQEKKEPYKLEKRKIVDDDILDILSYHEGIFMDVRTFGELLIHLMKTKIIIISSFTNISEYEPYPIQIMYLLLSISILIFNNAFLFLEKYLNKRFLTPGQLHFTYILTNELERCSISGAVSAVMLYLVTLFFTLKKKIKYQKYIQKTNERFFIEAEKLIKSYKLRNIISILICVLIMNIILLYITVFIEVYPKIYIILI